MKFISIVASLLLASSVSADMRIIGSNGISPVVSGQRVEFQAAPVLRFRGFASEQPSMVQGRGDNLPLNTVLEQLLPVDWTAEVDTDFSANRLSWSGNKDWVSLLRQVSQSVGVDMLIDYTDKMVYVGKEARTALEIKETTVQENLQEWCDKNSYRLVYLPIVQYHISHGTVLKPNTSFEDAVHLLIGSYRNTNHDDEVELHYEFNHANRVLVIGHSKSVIGQFFEGIL